MRLAIIKAISFKSALYSVNIKTALHILIYNTMFMEEISMSANKSKVNEGLAPLGYGYR